MCQNCSGPMLCPISLISLVLALSTEPGEGYGRCWNRGPEAVVSAALGCAPSRPVPQPPLGASEYEDCGAQGAVILCTEQMHACTA